jgi:hypothetical protein
MQANQYRVAFSGQIKQNADLNSVKIQMSKMFKRDMATIDRLFSGKKIVIQKNLTLERAKKIKSALSSIGAVSEIVSPPLESQKESKPLQATQRFEQAKKAAQKGLMKVQQKVEKVDFKNTKERIKDKINTLPVDEMRGRLGDVKTSIRSDLNSGGASALYKNKIVMASVGILFGILIMGFFLFGGSDKGRMPTDLETIQKFLTKIDRASRKIELGGITIIDRIKLVKKVVEDMGYDFDKTALYFTFHTELGFNPNTEPLVTNFFATPVSAAYMDDPKGLKKVVGEDTFSFWEANSMNEAGVSLESIQIYNECPKQGNIMKHEDLVGILKKRGVNVDDKYPAMAIYDKFFAMKVGKLVKIHSRNENGIEKNDIEILDDAQIRRALKSYQIKEDLKKKYY